MAVNAMGGAAKIDAIKTYADKMYLEVGNANAYNGLSIAFPDSFCEHHKRNESWWSTVASRRTRMVRFCRAIRADVAIAAATRSSAR